MSTRRIARTWPLWLGLLLLAASAELPRRMAASGAPGDGATGDAASGARPDVAPGAGASGARPEVASGVASAAADEPLARALVALGPVRALISSALWVELLAGQMRGDSERTAALSRALLAVHPGLSVVREYLAGQLIVTEAPRAPDRARHAALVGAGLQFFEEGLARDGAPALHGALGRALALQPEVDPRFAAAAEAYFGDDVEERAIDELRASRPSGLDAWLLAQLLADRGARALGLDGDRRTAARDLSEAASMLAGVSEASVEQRENLLAPLRAALAESSPRPAPAFDPEDADDTGRPDDSDAPDGSDVRDRR